jgi:hypothetical protein
MSGEPSPSKAKELQAELLKASAMAALLTPCKHPATLLSGVTICDHAVLQLQEVVKGMDPAEMQATVAKVSSTLLLACNQSKVALL